MESEAPLFGATADVFPLAFPKGQKKLCELCNSPARLQCVNCRVTYYCAVEHQEADWVGIHEKICELLIPVRTPTLSRSTLKEIQKKKRELVEVCRSVTKKKLFEGKYQEALPAAQFCLRCTEEVYGSESVQMVPPNMLLVQANMGLGNVKLATEILYQAEWVVSRNPECSHTLLQQLHSNFGRLYTLNADWENARFHIANDIYYSSVEYGVESTVTASGYYLMADPFLKTGKTHIARSLYCEVTSIWYNHLTDLFEQYKKNLPTPSTVQDSFQNQCKRAEGEQMLKGILEFYKNDPGKDFSQITTVTYGLAVLGLLEGDNQKAVDLGTKALQTSLLTARRDLTKAIEGFLEFLQSLEAAKEHVIE